MARAERARCTPADDADLGPAGARLLDAIELLVRRFSLSERADVSCCGLTVAQAATLDVLGAEGPLRQRELSRRLGIRASTLTRNLDRLEQAGLLERRPDPGDARATRIGLSGAGRGAAARVRAQKEAFAAAILARIPEERRGTLLAGIDALLGAVRDATESCCPGAFDHLLGAKPRASKGKADGTDCCE